MTPTPFWPEFFSGDTILPHIITQYKTKQFNIHHAPVIMDNMKIAVYMCFSKNQNIDS